MVYFVVLYAVVSRSKETMDNLLPSHSLVNGDGPILPFVRTANSVCSIPDFIALLARVSNYAQTQYVTDVLCTRNMSRLHKLYFISNLGIVFSFCWQMVHVKTLMANQVAVLV